MGKIQEIIADTTWELVSFQSEDKNGEIIYPLGKNAKGFILFTSGNRISVHIMAVDRNKDTTLQFLTEAEEKMSDLGYHAYTGSFVIDEEKEILETSVEVSLISSYVGSKQPRKVKTENGNLYLTNVKHPERQLVWKPVEN